VDLAADLVEVGAQAAALQLVDETCSIGLYSCMCRNSSRRIASFVSISCMAKRYSSRKRCI
jgi:hypothetical protein